MKTREMYAPRDHDDRSVFHVMGYAPDDVSRYVRVLVTEIPEGRPDFRPGDRVRIDSNQQGTVRGYPVACSDGWKVIVDGPGGGGAFQCARLTKPPREITRTIRVTGPEDNVQAFVDRVAVDGSLNPKHKGVRVEVSDAD